MVTKSVSRGASDDVDKKRVEFKLGDKPSHQMRNGSARTIAQFDECL